MFNLIGAGLYSSFVFKKSDQDAKTSIVNLTYMVLIKLMKRPALPYQEVYIFFCFTGQYVNLLIEKTRMALKVAGNIGISG